MRPGVGRQKGRIETRGGGSLVGTRLNGFVCQV